MEEMGDLLLLPAGEAGCVCAGGVAALPGPGGGGMQWLHVLET